ncbi:MBL fold metallo-hydrolase [Flammeovirgaceae bacterium KN852]|uniref:MBL fold metallo-hydrolase n=2 Tax=Marinigracilibium pacificum TaxID=2729599 RepID=A0A848J3B7_9BACT|nr:rhodanese-like domain-containing protein [Marinigracilibium pacificum]NMM48984.1 MBL fold metallo-hydrolase [Marinigracilibium pacificum]
MKLEQIYTSCLAQGAYYIESEGEVAIIDPLRETEPYLERANNSGAKIKYVFETHFHADFVSGHMELADKTGAEIIYGPGAKTDFTITEGKDGDEFKVGKLTIKLIHTPGHTLESSCYLLSDETGTPKALFSGDTLFIGDVGRPDLAIKSDLTKEDLAGMLYDSLRNKVMTLPDDIIVYPAHGAGSACGKNMSNETSDTLGNQKQTNYALAEDLSKEDFIKEVTCGIMPPPQYFAKNAQLNKSGVRNLDDVLEVGTRGLAVDQFLEIKETEKAMILDVRSADDYAAGAIPGSIFIGIDGSFAPWVGALVTDLETPILLVTPDGREEETVTRLARVGYDNTLGFLKGGIEVWKEAGNDIQTINRVTAEEFEENYSNYKQPVDVRKPGEYENEHVSGSPLKPLDFIVDWQDEFAKDTELTLFCRGGYRSMIAASILKARGYQNLTDVIGGFNKIKQTGLKIVSLSKVN